jgi:hypothetical protein
VRFALAILLLSAPLHAFCVLPVGHTGSVRIARTEIVIVHRAPVMAGETVETPGVQEMLLRITPVFDGEAPTRLAWIIPLPSVATGRATADPAALYAGIELHTRLFGLARDQWARRTEYEWPEALTWLQKRDQPSLHPIAGPALPELSLAASPTLTALDGIGADAVIQLNNWLRERGFRTLPDADTAWFAEHACSFLCVIVSPSEGQARLGAAVEMPPIKVRFKADAPFVPLLVGPGQPRGRLDIAMITDTPLDTRPYMGARERVKASESGYVLLLNLWSIQPLPGALAEALDANIAKQPKRWYANRIESPGLPEEQGQPRTDLSLPLGDLSDELPGFWYYGDDDISVMERFFREHILAVTTTLFFAGLLALIIKARRNRRRLLPR